jgi:3-hydroxy acid dehydrogenase/malonic semialdehyde reductase
MSRARLTYASRLIANSLRAPFRPRVPAPLIHHFHLHAHAHAMSSAVASRLAGKTILITGASSGIGRATALEFARTQPDDLKLVLTARREEALAELKKEIEGVAKGVKVAVVKLDVSNVEEVRGFVKALPEGFGEVDVLVNNA